MNDLLENETYVLYVFDGEKVLGSTYGCDLINEMDSAPKHKMSKEFAVFNYNELRLLLDCKYGLKSEHGIENFETFLNINTDLVSDLVSTDPMRASLSLIKLTSLYFDDLHSAFIRGSYLYEKDRGIEGQVQSVYTGPSKIRYDELEEIYSNARKEVYPDEVPGYEEVGDTAFITFDEFAKKRDNYYDSGIDRDQPEDTIDLIIYANHQIKREGSPIRNIVLDMSNNGGGEASAAIFVISWFLGEADIALRDVFTGAGSCVILPCTTAAGAVFQISGSMQLSIIRNGSFYNIDSGITPHFFLDKPESFYDRPALAEYLRELK